MAVFQYFKTEYKQKQERAYTNAHEEVSSLDASTYGLSHVIYYSVLQKKIFFMLFRKN